MKRRILALFLCALTLFSVCSGLVSCGKSKKKDAFVIMTEALDGLFNPFFSTSATDSTIVGMTQIGMLSSKYVNGSVEVAYGDNEAVVVKDYSEKYDPETDETVYTFVLKNGILYSDGHPLTMEDVLFNLYVYLDPVYTGSSTMYSTKIQGLLNYRTQKFNSDSDGNDGLVDSQAASRANDRINELKNIFRSFQKGTGGIYADYNSMKNAILSSSLTTTYKMAISNNPDEVTTEQLLKDYENTLKKFKEELESDYVGAQDSYTEEPYKSREEFKDPVVCFMYTEGYVTIEWEKDPVTNEDDKSKIKNVILGYTENIKTKEDAINYVYNAKTTSELDIILDYWATGQELRTEYTAKAKEVILHEGLVDGQLNVDNIEGIVSLGHNASTKGTTINVNGTNYKVASAHNSDGTVTNADEYDVLQITIDGVDPKAIWNFAFTVAPQHYYGENSSVGVDIENNKFGVEFGSFSFMQDIIQSTRNIKLPMGAGAYKVTNRANEDSPSASDFYKDNVVYFKKNDNFHTVGTGIENAKIEKIRYQVVSASNAIGALESGDVDYITPQLTNENFEKLGALSSKGVKYLLDDQLGYGYIGINAVKVPNLNIRKAIMSAMNTSLAIDYYRPGTASQIYWPMSVVSWAYPKENGVPSKDNGVGYPQLGVFNEETAKKNILAYMEEAGVSAGDDELEITFTIAGSNLQDHPTYKTFRDAAALLNSLGWKVDVKPDTQALTKINTGALEVWAAAWGSALDPDMYQVYHKNSTATSTLAWGYSQIKVDPDTKYILDELSDLIDDARETNDQTVRSQKYKEAMQKVLEMAIELPVYQRSVVYAYNSKVINPDSLPKEMNPYSSPLDRIWEIEFAK